NCTCRGTVADRTVANPALPNDTFGSPKFGWLVALNISARNCSFVVSVMRKNLEIDVLSALDPGPSITLRPDVPNVNGAGAWKAAFSNQRSTFLASGSRFAGHTRLGRAGPVDALLVARVVTVSGKPVRAVNAPLTCQPAATALTNGFRGRNGT